MTQNPHHTFRLPADLVAQVRAIFNTLPRDTAPTLGGFVASLLETGLEAHIAARTAAKPAPRGKPRRK